MLPSSPQDSVEINNYAHDVALGFSCLFNSKVK